MVMQAVHRGARISSRKVRLVADLVRGKYADEALAILKYQPQRGARMLEKVLQSAVGNAQDPNQNEGRSYKIEDLVVTEGALIEKINASGAWNDEIEAAFDALGTYRERPGGQDIIDWANALCQLYLATTQLER